MCCFNHTSNTINLVTASVDASVGIVEHTIFIPDVVDCRAPTHGVIFAKYVAQITKQQGRYAVGHGLSPLVIRSRGRKSASLSRCTHPRKVAARRGVLIVQIIDYRNPAIQSEPTHLARLNCCPQTWPAFGAPQSASPQRPARIPRLHPREGHSIASPRSGCALP